MPNLSRKAVVAKGALLAYLRPKMAKDARLDLNAILAGVDAKNFTAKKPVILADVRKAMQGKLAQDAKLDDMEEAVDSVEKEEEADDEMGPRGKDKGAKDGEAREFLKGKLSEDDMKSYDAMCAKDEPDDDDKKDKAKDKAKDKMGAKDEPKEEMVSKKAMDSAINGAVARAQDEMKKTMREIEEARDICRPYGKVAGACDSADAVFRATLNALGKDVSDVKDAAALKHILLAHPKPGERQRDPARMATDAAGDFAFAKMFPQAAAIGAV